MFIGKRREKGFSLAEMLMVLLILAQIATFTIPKVLTAQQNNLRKAVFKETHSVLNQIIYQGVMQEGRDLKSTPRLTDYLKDKLNHVRYCTDAVGEGCVDADAGTAIDAQVPGTWSTDPCFVLHNGAVLFRSYHTDGTAQFIIMLFGSKGKNVINDDLLRLRANLNMDGTVINTIRPGLVECHNPTSVDCQWYSDIFQ